MSKSIFIKSIKLFLIITIICGIIYPLIITGISQVFFKDKANGSIVEVKGVKYGSELLGQQYTGNEYMWGRIMNISTSTFSDKEGNPVMYASPSNKTPASKEYKELIANRVKKINETNPSAKEDKIPVDLVTCSGSGLDPHISVAAADYQVERIATSRNMKTDDVQKIIDKYTSSRLFGVFGEKVVNVLEVNLALDGILK
ncbi:potassium-transporting ATPase subunit KdpC [Anaeromicropila herbilytica]|uniref:Potassium-transporting ATPase KdpC subunit n=1 Tax=Anaeromicropila herbilytica TaxID=2785025 RepID=A0A7R7IBL0_9FIRM|nr:potassium-transporting ATPase KdpC subunit [Anaeromicropila herbilytica]